MVAVEAAKAAGHATEGATLYVSLEPCCPFPGKRTPACVDLALASGFRRVVTGQTDPNPDVSGKALARLKEAGVEVTSGVLERQARLLNQPFTKWMTTGLPYLTGKDQLSRNLQRAAEMALLV